MKNKISTILLFVMLFVGLSLLLYPTLSDYWNSFHQSKLISSYADTVAKLDEEDYESIMQQAEEYNKNLHKKENRWVMSNEEKREYNSVLDVTGTGIMGYIEIPEINVALPIYHGTDEAVLQIAIGHLQGSTLPIGGVGNHSVVSGHRGLPSAKLFTNLDKLVEGDDFVIRVLNEVYTYEVDKIWIVEPNDLSPLTFDESKDYCTLVTCTPYGVNTHRLLVRGHRVENAKDSANVKVTADAVQIDPVVVAPIVAVPMLLTLFIVMMVTTGRKNAKNKR